MRPICGVYIGVIVRAVLAQPSLGAYHDIRNSASSRLNCTTLKGRYSKTRPWFYIYPIPLNGYHRNSGYC